MKTIRLTALWLFLTAAVAAGDETTPDFSGTWVLNQARSRLEMTAPTKGTSWIEHHGGSIKLTRTLAWDERWNTLSIEMPIDGEEHYRKTEFSESWSRMVWLRDELVLDMKLAFGEEQGTNVVHYRLEDEGQTIVAAEWYHGPNEQHHNLWVLERVPDVEAVEYRDRLKEFAERYTAAWGSQDPASVATFFSAEGSLRVNDGEPAIGRDAIAAIAEEFMTALPDMVLHFDGLDGGGERINFYWTLEANNSGPGGTGHKVLVSGHESWRLDEGGLIAESQGHFPAAQYERQLEVGYEGPPPSSSGSAAEPLEPLEGPYLGQEPPGPTGTTFAPGFVSTRARELNATFTPDGDELYFTRRIDERMTLMVSRRVEGVWTPPTVVGFSGVFADVDPFVSRDGSRLYFSSKRPLEGDGEEKDADLWFVERQADGGWGEPLHLDELASEDKDDYYTSVSDEGVLYFSIFGSDGKGDIYRAREEDGGFGAAEKVGAPISTEATEHDPFIAPDGSYLIFTSDRAGGRGSGDLWISFAVPDGSWAEPVNMDAVNSPGYDFCAMLSPDGRYLFFTSSVDRENDVFWVDAQVIEELRPPGS